MSVNVRNDRTIVSIVNNRPLDHGFGFRSRMLVGLNVAFACALLLVPNLDPQSSGQEPSAQAKATQEAFKASNDLLKAQWAAWSARQKRARLAAAKKPAIAASFADRSRVDERFRPAPEQAGLARSSTTPWYRPTEVVSAGGTLSVTLTIDYASLTLGADPVRLRCYNGVLAGPTLRARPGDLLKIKLVNALPPNPVSGEHANNTLHEYNTTNLHTHGLHVSPAGNSDNVLLDVLPGTTQDYEIQIPVNHPSGAFWYHAHRHGSVAAQVSSGVSGAIIIDGGMDAVPEIAATKGDHDRIVILQQIPYVIPPGETEGVIEEGGSDFGPDAWNNSGRFTSINGVILPVIELKPGEVERWRFVDSGFRERIDLRLIRDSGSGPANLDFHEIASDGIPLGKRNTTPGIELWPGYRSEALIQAPMVEGTYLLIDEAVPPAQTMVGDGKNRKYLAKIVVSGTPNPMGLPASTNLAAYRPPSIPASAVTGTQTATYGIDPVPGSVEFHIDGKSYDPNASPRMLTLGSVEEWTINSMNGVGPITHPFHIHVNPFEIFSIKDSNGVEQLTAPIWKDTVAMKPNTVIKFRTQYLDFTGDFVQHCHILDHEDQGMMQKIRILPASGPPTPPAPNNVREAKSPAKLKALSVASDSPSVLLFVTGSTCSHCMNQIVNLDKLLAGRGAKVTVITASSAEDLKRFPKGSFNLVPDPDLKLFKQHGLFEVKAKHATIVHDRGGHELLRKVGEAPFADHEAVLAALGQAAPSFAIAVANTDSPDDDYITWAPTPCRIRITNPVAGSADVTVTLTNNSTVNPDAGRVRFAATIANGQTATNETLTLTVKGDGTPTDFFIAGSKASALTTASLADKGRDTVIEIHKDTAAGDVLGRQAVMVRVRKDMAVVNALERKALQSAIAQLHTNPAGGGEDLYLLLLKIHSLSVMSPNARDYPNQAHNGPAFLAWHRAYILRFERELQKLDPTVSLHYWRMNQQPGPGLPALVFDPQSWGANASGSGIAGPVSFDPANPLFGWQIESEPLSRSLQNRSNISVFLPETSVLNYDKYRDDDTGHAFSEDLEANNHNHGHSWVGSWMAFCQQSPRDPIFWLFHCDLDRSWALWQATRGRFGTTGVNESDYMPNDAYSPGSFNAKGHHLKDTMWPWDGVTGPGAAGDPNSDRPPSAPGGMFPKALLPGLWPSVDAKPRPADMIDYLGVEDHAHNLGYCYDIVPFGTIEAPQIVAAAPTARLNADATWTERRNAVQALPPRKPETKAKLLEILNSRKNDDVLRIEALRRLARGNASDAFDAALAIVRDTENGGKDLQLAAVQTLAELCLFHRLTADRHHEAEAALANVVKAGAVPLRHAAIESLAVLQAGDAPVLLRGQLESKTPWLSPVEAIPLLKMASPRSDETFAALRRHLDSADPATQALAIGGLEGDTATRQRRLEFLLDADAPSAVRSAALHSLMHNDPGFPDAALHIGLDSASDPELRREAVAGLAVFARTNPVAKEKLTGWIAKLRPLESAPRKNLRTTATLIIQSLEKLALSR
jgi:FtsP/CotA-like multicopper oxidase with cupredoxin domain/peroxiredoxin